MEIIRKFLHDKLGWGYPYDNLISDGFQMYSKCQRCQSKLCMDSQGNWFHLSK